MIARNSQRTTTKLDFAGHVWRDGGRKSGTDEAGAVFGKKASLTTNSPASRSSTRWAQRNFSGAKWSPERPLIGDESDADGESDGESDGGGGNDDGEPKAPRKRKLFMVRGRMKKSVRKKDYAKMYEKERKEYEETAGVINLAACVRATGRKFEGTLRKVSALSLRRLSRIWAGHDLCTTAVG